MHVPILHDSAADFTNSCSCQTDSPSEAKHFTVTGTLANIVRHFAPTWADSTRAHTAEGKKVLSFLLNLVSCVCLLPSEDTPVLPSLDKRLLPAFGALCAAEPELRDTYSAVAGIALKAVLEAKTMKSLFQLADEAGVDVDDCTSKEAVVQALLASGKRLAPSPMIGKRAAIERHTAPGPVRDAATDRDALMELFEATSGGSWSNSSGWGTSRPLGEWYGVTVDSGGRVIKLDLHENNLKGGWISLVVAAGYIFIHKTAVRR